MVLTLIMFQIHVLSVDRKEVDDYEICIELKNASTSDSSRGMECPYYYVHTLSLIVRYFIIFTFF